MGGVITRAALPHLAEFKLNMFTFVSLSSPHVGYGYNNSLLIDAGRVDLQFRVVVFEANEKIYFSLTACYDGR